MEARMAINECEIAQNESLQLDPETRLSMAVVIGAASAADIKGLNDSLERAKKRLNSEIKKLKKLYAAKKYRLYQRNQAYRQYKRDELSSTSNPNPKKKREFKARAKEGKALVEDFDKLIKNIDTSISATASNIRNLKKNIKEGTRVLNREMKEFTRNLRR